MEKIFDIAKDSEKSWGVIAQGIDGNFEELSVEIKEVKGIDVSKIIPTNLGQSINTTIIGYNDQNSIKEIMYKDEEVSLFLKDTSIVDYLKVLALPIGTSEYIDLDVIYPNIEKRVVLDKDIEAIGFYYSSAKESGNIVVQAKVDRSIEKHEKDISKLKDLVTKYSDDVKNVVVKYLDGTLLNDTFKANKDGVSFEYRFDTPADKFTLNVSKIIGNTDKYLVHQYDVEGVQSTLMGYCYFGKDYEITIDKSAYPVLRLYAADSYGTAIYPQDETCFAVKCFNESIYEEQIRYARPLLEKKVVMFGDSITQLPNTSDVRGNGIVEYFSKLTGAKVYRAAIGGSKLTRYKNVDSVVDGTTASDAVQIVTIVESFCKGDMSIPIEGMQYKIAHGSGDSYVLEMLQELSKISITDVDIVTIFGGTNDCSSGIDLTDGDNASLDTSNIRGAINYMIKTILESNPKIKIYLYTPIIRKYDPNDDSTWSDDYVNNSKGVLLPQYVEEIKAIGKYNHIPTCDLYNDMGWNKYNFHEFCLPTDLTHPRFGFDRLAEKMSSFILGNL